MVRKYKLILLCITITLCLCLLSSAIASSDEQNTTLTKSGDMDMEDYLEFQRNLPDVVKTMPFRGLAFAATSPESQKIKMGYIDNFDVSDEKKAEYKAGLQDIWDRYPDEITKHDYLFMLELGPMIEAEAFSVYSPEEMGVIRTVDRVENESEHDNKTVIVWLLPIAFLVLYLYYVKN